MTRNDDEVVDVEEFYENLQNRAYSDLNRKYQELKKSNNKLDTQVNNMRRDNDDLRHKLFEQDQLRYKLARLLGFENAESAEQSIAPEDLQMSGGQAALSEARSRLLLLEDELAKHIAAGKEAQSVLTDTDNQLKLAHQHLEETLQEASRLRAERDLARQEAERQAMEATRWRVEAQTTLPEMQNLIRELQNKNMAHLGSRLIDEREMETCSPGRLEQGDSPFHEVANASSPTAVHSSPMYLALSSNGHYKQRLELLEAKYQSLLETKEKISQRFREHLLKWKRFKNWLVKDEALRGGKVTTWRRILRRRRAMEDIGPVMNQEDMELNGDFVSVAQYGLVKDSDFTVTDPINESSAHDRGGATNGSRHSNKYPHFPVALDSPSPNKPRLEKSLTVANNIPGSKHPTATDLTPGHPSKIKPLGSQPVNNEVSPSQESLTQPSSMMGDGPSQVHEAMPSTPTGQPTRSEVISIDSSPIREAVSEEMGHVEESATDGDELSEQQIDGLGRKSPLHTATPCTSTQSQPDCKKPMIMQSISELPPTKRHGLFSQPKTPKRQAIRRASTVLATDTPPRTSPSTVLRHRSSPPDSPHVPRLTKRKRKAFDIERSRRDEESDPFTTGTPRAGAKPAVSQTREGKLAHLKALDRKSHKAYMAEYMQFKGRGRYSNVHETPDKTVNDEFEIDPDKNGGLNFQYDTTVRDKAERRMLEAGDCECCRDYYEAIGTLPPRPQAPLWKSPSSSQNLRATRPCRYEKNRIDQETVLLSPSTVAHKQAVDAHKHDISRHRHDWAPPKTPPDFWKIEFPDTQAVDDINRRANEMHASKFRRIEAEANSNSGRYRKRI